MYTGDVFGYKVISLAAGSAGAGLLLLFVLVTVIVIAVLKKNKWKAYNFSSNVAYQSNTRIRHTENGEAFGDSGSVTTHINAAYKTSQPPLVDRLDVVYDTVIEHSSLKERDSKLTVYQNEAYESLNLVVSHNISYAPL